MFVLSDSVRAAIARHAEETYPDECVGLLLGRLNGRRTDVAEIYQAANEWTAEINLAGADEDHSRRDRFYLDPREYLRADRAAGDRGLDIVGCYHSHPDHPAIPSPRDLVGAQGVGGGSRFGFLIQSVRDGRAAELTAWLLVDDGGRFVTEELR